jgi:hypothetical protein
VTDGEEYPAQVAQQLPQFRVRNFGVPGYGTLQSLLLLRRQLKRHPKPPVLIVYGFMFHHAARNVATSQWLKSLRQIDFRESYVALPYARLNENNELMFYPLRKYVKWPLSEHLAFMSLLQDRLASIDDDGLDKQAGPVTVELIRQLNEEAKAFKAQFVVFSFWDASEANKNYYLSHCNKQSITFLDCGKLPPLGPDLVVPHDGHPNVMVHRLWAKRFLEHVKPRGAPKG